MDNLRLHNELFNLFPDCDVSVVERITNTTAVWGANVSSKPIQCECGHAIPETLYSSYGFPSPIAVLEDIKQQAGVANAKNRILD